MARLVNRPGLGRGMTKVEVGEKQLDSYPEGSRRLVIGEPSPCHGWPQKRAASFHLPYDHLNHTFPHPVRMYGRTSVGPANLEVVCATLSRSFKYDPSICVGFSFSVGVKTW